MAALTPGTRLGTYEIVAPLGAGGMGEVHRARDLRLGREVAVKVLPAELASNPDRLARFEREARTVAGLNHPNIVTLHSVEEEDGIRFLTMELVEGQTLAALVVPGGLPIAQVLELAIPLADALVAAHEKRVIHRDLKTGNVMVTRDGRVKVLDFGLARLVPAESNPELSTAATMVSPISEVGQVVGTAAYMAPEQVRGETADARSDVFALGILIYELAAGHRPFTGGSSAEITSAILRDSPIPLTRVRTDLPADLERIVSRCLEKNPRARIQSALDVSNELRRLRKALERGESGAIARPAMEKVASIAVLPFVNRSASADDEYFSEGLSDELLNVLAKIKGLPVTARSSAFTFKGKQATAAEIGHALNVASLLEGSVRKAGNRIRVSVQLVNVADSSHLWSETYDRTLDDIFAVQDDIAQSVVKELRTTLLGRAADSDASGEAKAEVAQAAKGRGTDPEAHRLYLLARHLIDRNTREDTAKGIEYLKQALERDSSFALAWAELSMAYAREADLAWAPIAEGYGRAREAAEHSLALEPDLAEAHAAIGWLRITHDWDWRGAEASYSRALELAPGNGTVVRRASLLKHTLGHPEDAIVAHHAANHLAEAEVAFRKALELAPQRAITHGRLALILLDQGRGEEAVAEAMREPHEGVSLYAQAIVYAVLGNSVKSEAALREMIEKHAEETAYQIAEVYAVQGDADRTFEWLERAYAHRDGGLTELKISPRLRSLHGDPRWAPFVKKMGLAD